MNHIEKIRALPLMSMRLHALADWIEAGGAGVTFDYYASCRCVAGHIVEARGWRAKEDEFLDSLPEDIEHVIGQLTLHGQTQDLTISEVIYEGFEAVMAQEFNLPRSTSYFDGLTAHHAASVIRALATRIEVLLKDIEEDSKIIKVEAPEAEWEMVEVGSS